MALGPGYTDANGVRHYGEDDLTGPLFSDFLDLSLDSISDQFAADRALIERARTFATGSAAARDTHWGAILGLSGAGGTPANAAERLALQNSAAVTFRTDQGWSERYFAAQDDGGTNANPGGLLVAGWYRQSTPRHVELSATSASVASGTNAGVGTLTRAASPSTNDKLFATISSNSLIVAEDGIYSLDCWGSLAAAPTGPFYVMANSSGRSFRVNGTTVAGTFGGSLFSNLFLPSAATFSLDFFHTSAAARVLTSAFSFSRVG
jgi:hypothetical protein